MRGEHVAGQSHSIARGIAGMLTWRRRRAEVTVLVGSEECVR